MEQKYIETENQKVAEEMKVNKNFAFKKVHNFKVYVFNQIYYKIIIN